MLKNLFLQLFVENQVGVLDRISVIIRRSGWNVKDVNACEEPWHKGSRISLTIEGRADTNLLLNQLKRLDCMRELHCSESNTALGHGLAMARVPTAARADLQALATRFGANLLREDAEGVTYMLCANGNDINQFLAVCAKLPDASIMRTGVIDL